MTKIPTNSWRMRECLLDRNSFETFGAMRASTGADVHRDGLRSWDSRLPENYRQEFNAAAHAGRVVYVVWSYNTPIAWVLDDVTTGEVVIPPVKYSVTTSKHQGALYALQMMPGDPATLPERMSIRAAAQRERSDATERLRQYREDRREREAAEVRAYRTPEAIHRYAEAARLRAAQEGPYGVGLRTPDPMASEDPSATLEDRIAALEAETFQQIADTSEVLSHSRRALRIEASESASLVRWERRTREESQQ